MPLEKVTEIFTCYIGMLKHTDSQALIDKLYEDMVLIKGGSDEKEEKEEFVGTVNVNIALVATFLPDSIHAADVSF